MTTKEIFIGLDGGGTKTLTIAINRDGKEIARHQSACSNYNSVGAEKARIAVLEGIDSVISQSGGKDNVKISGICLGMSGVNRDNDKKLVSSWLEEHLPGVPFQLHNDAVVALASGTGGKLFGIVLISGTGCISFGYDKEGRSTRAAGWGPLLGDKGSGYQIGNDLCAAVCRAHDESSPKTSLTKEVLEELKLNTVDELIGWAYDPNNQNWHRWAALAPIVNKCAMEGDQVALEILKENGDALALSVESVIKKLGLDKEPQFPLVLAGGMISRECILTKNLKSTLLAKYPQIQFYFQECDSAMGAALLSLNSDKSK